MVSRWQHKSWSKWLQCHWCQAVSIFAIPWLGQHWCHGEGRDPMWATAGLPALTAQACTLENALQCADPWSLETGGCQQQQQQHCVYGCSGGCWRIVCMVVVVAFFFPTTFKLQATGRSGWYSNFTSLFFYSGLQCLQIPYTLRNHGIWQTWIDIPRGQDAVTQSCYSSEVQYWHEEFTSDMSEEEKRNHRTSGRRYQGLNRVAVLFFLSFEAYACERWENWISHLHKYPMRTPEMMQSVLPLSAMWHAPC